MIDWLFYLLGASGLLALAARAAEEVAALYGRPTRWVWAVALALSALLPAVGMVVAGRPQPVGEVVAVASESGMAPAPVAASEGVFEWSAGPGAWRTLSPSTERLLLLGWLGASGLLLVVAGVGHARLMRARRRWPRVRLCGVPVHVSRRAGPAVLGVVRPAIVVPGWLLRSAAQVRRMVVLHEGEHVRGQDARLLAVGCLLAAAVPWNPVVWWLLWRLRGAVEVDCDARVLRRGAEPGAYGAMLLGVAHRASLLSFAVALKQPPSLIERRILTMTRSRPRFRSGRACALAAAAAALVAAAFTMNSPAPLAAVALLAGPSGPAALQEPTQEVVVTLPAQLARELRDGGSVLFSGLDVRVRLAPGVTVREALPGASAEPLLIVDDVIVGNGYYQPGELIEADRSAQIASVQVIKGGSDVARVGGPIVWVRTRPAVEDEPVRPRQAIPAEAGGRVSVVGSAPLLIVDGIVLGRGADVKAIDPARIDRIEVIKGPAAERLYGARGADGVIQIITKDGRTEQASARASAGAAVAAVQERAAAVAIERAAVAASRDARFRPGQGRAIEGRVTVAPLARRESPVTVMRAAAEAGEAARVVERAASARQQPRAVVGAASGRRDGIIVSRLRSAREQDVLVTSALAAQARAVETRAAATRSVAITSTPSVVAPVSGGSAVTLAAPVARGAAAGVTRAAPVDRVIRVPSGIVEALRTQGSLPFATPNGQLRLRVGEGVRLEAGAPAASGHAILVVDGVIVGLTSQFESGPGSTLGRLRAEEIESVDVVKVSGSSDAARFGYPFVFITRKAPAAR